MKSLGIVRKVDELGRVVLPVELRRTLDIKEKEGLEIFVDEDCIILKKFSPGCTFCGERNNNTTYKGKIICSECLKALKGGI